MKTFIVEFWSRVFGTLRWISVLQIIRTIFPKLRGRPGPIELWVLGNLLLSFMLLLLSMAPGIQWWEWVVVLWGAVRIFEIIIYQINVLLFDAYRANTEGRRYALHSYRRLVILSLHNYIEIILWFAIFYRNSDWAFKGDQLDVDSFLGSLKLSFVTMTAFGETGILPATTLGELLTLFQSGIGLFMVLLIIARFIGLMPAPGTLDASEK